MEDLHTAYGVPGLVCDGNNVLDTWAAARLLVDDGRRGRGPSILTALTFRMGGHATHDEAEARALFPEEVFRRWGRRDPIGTYEAWLVEHDLSLDGRKRAGAAARRKANAAVLADAEARVTTEVEAAAEEALGSKRDRMPDPADALRGVYAEPRPPAATAARRRSRLAAGQRVFGS